MREVAIDETPVVLSYSGSRHRNVKDVSHFVSVDRIDTVVTSHFNISMECLKNSCRKMEIVYCRQVLMYFYARYTNLSYKSIGDMFGGRDHSTVMHSEDMIEDRIKTDDKVFYEIKELTEKLHNMNLKVTSEKDAIKMAADSIHILNNLRDASKKYKLTPGFDTRQNKRRWEEIADEFLKKVSASEPTDNFEAVKIILTNELS